MKNSKENSFQLRYDNAFRIRFRHHDFTKVFSWKSGGEGGSCEHLLGAPRVRVAVLNFTLFKGSTIEATRERKVTPRPHPLFSLSLATALQGFKQLGMVHGSSHNTQ